MNIEQLLQDLTKINGEIDHHTNTGDHFMIIRTIRLCSGHI